MLLQPQNQLVQDGIGIFGLSTYERVSLCKALYLAISAVSQQPSANVRYKDLWPVPFLHKRQSIPCG